MYVATVTPAQRFYQLGWSRNKAVLNGACGAEFDQLVAKYRDESIPVCDLYGFKRGNDYRFKRTW